MNVFMLKSHTKRVKQIPETPCSNTLWRSPGGPDDHDDRVDGRGRLGGDEFSQPPLVEAVACTDVLGLRQDQNGEAVGVGGLEVELEVASHRRGQTGGAVEADVGEDDASSSTSRLLTPMASPS